MLNGIFLEIGIDLTLRLYRIVKKIPVYALFPDQHL